MKKLCETYISLHKRRQLVRWFVELAKSHAGSYPTLFELMDKEKMWVERLVLSGQLPTNNASDE
jgi:hypothetical protein